MLGSITAAAWEGSSIVESHLRRSLVTHKPSLVLPGCLAEADLRPTDAMNPCDSRISLVSAASASQARGALWALSGSVLGEAESGDQDVNPTKKK